MEEKSIGWQVLERAKAKNYRLAGPTFESLVAGMAHELPYPDVAAKLEEYLKLIVTENEKISRRKRTVEEIKMAAARDFENFWEYFKRWLTTQKNPPAIPQQVERSVGLAHKFWLEFMTPIFLHPEYREKAQPRIRAGATESILNSGIFNGNSLIGHKGHNKKYPVVLKRLLDDLIQTYQYSEMMKPGSKKGIGLIIYCFNMRFKLIAEAARFAGVKEADIRKVWRSWRGKLFSQLKQSGTAISGWLDYWRPKEIKIVLSQQIAEVILKHTVRQTPPTARVAKWVNAILKALGEEPAKERSLRTYIEGKRVICNALYCGLEYPFEEDPF